MTFLEKSRSSSAMGLIFPKKSEATKTFGPFVMFGHCQGNSRGTSNPVRDDKLADMRVDRDLFPLFRSEQPAPFEIIAVNVELAKVVELMVRDCGMGETVGQVAVGLRRLADGPMSIRVMKSVEKIVRGQLNRSIRELEEHRACLDRLVDVLMDRNRLTRIELEPLMEGLGLGDRHHCGNGNVLGGGF